MLKFASYLAAGILLLAAHPSRAAETKFATDADVAAAPIIVEAVWERAPTEVHEQYSKLDVLKLLPLQQEKSSKLKVLRTIKGEEIPPGEYPLLIEFNTSWDGEGKQIRYSKPYRMTFYEVEDLQRPHLWFLHRKRSWDATRPGEQLYLSSPRHVQHLYLQPYFEALGSDSPEVEVPKLLTHGDYSIRYRVLEYLPGGATPWPYHQFPWERSKWPGKKHSDEADRVWDLVVNSDNEHERPKAVSVFAELAGASARNRLRLLLTDKDPTVRCFAAGLLARARDDTFLQQSAALAGMKREHFGCEIVEVYAGWDDPRVIPCLIAFLENDAILSNGEDLRIPALKARHALKQRTGHWFPYRVQESREIWKQVLSESDETKRRETLRRLLPEPECPLEGEVVVETVEGPPQPGEARSKPVHNVRVKLKNTGGRAISVLKRPSESHVTSGGLLLKTDWSHRWDSSPPEAYVTLSPQEVFELPTEIGKRISFRIQNDCSCSLVFSS